MPNRSASVRPLGGRLDPSRAGCPRARLILLHSRGIAPTIADMHLIEQNDQIERIFLPWRLPLGKAYDGYKGHVYRVLNFTCALLDCDDTDMHEYGKPQEVQDRIAIASCFHDVAIWLDKTMDYLDPSIAHAEAWLNERGLAQWSPEVSLMIKWHHKQTRYTGDHDCLVEAFRRADLVDVMLGARRFGIPGSFVRDVRRAFPNNGFHWTLAKGIVPYALKHPTKPMPMMKR